MKKTAWTLIAVVLCFSIVFAGVQEKEYEPTMGQPGKDVIWVPTPDELVKAMLDLAKVTSKDYLIDLGSGDGRIVIAAAKRGARAVGIEFNPDMVQLSNRNAEKAGVSDKASFKNGDIFEADLSEATVISMYLLPSLNMKLRPKLLDLKPGTRIVTNSFTMEDWHWDDSAMVEGRPAYLWIVPAKVHGNWTWSSKEGTAELNLSQKFQKLEGTLKIDGKSRSIRDGKLQGDHISFVCDGRSFSGQVAGNSIQGVITRGGQSEGWSANLM